MFTVVSDYIKPGVHRVRGLIMLVSYIRNNSADNAGVVNRQLEDKEQVLRLRQQGRQKQREGRGFSVHKHKGFSHISVHLDTHFYMFCI